MRRRVGDAAPAAAPVVASTRAAIVAVGPRDEVERPLERDGHRHRRDRAPRREAAGTVTPGTHRSAHAPAVRRHARTPRSSCASAATPTSRSSRPAAASCQTVRMTRAASDDELLDARPPLAARDAAATASPRSRRSPATGSTATELRLLDGRARARRAKDRSRCVPTFLGAHAVAPEFRDRPGRRRGIRRQRHRRAAARCRGAGHRARSATSSASRACSTPIRAGAPARRAAGSA